jgi:hypothetical protein
MHQQPWARTKDFRFATVPSKRAGGRNQQWLCVVFATNFYLEDRERTFDSPTNKLLMSVTAFADELEREKARQRTYDAIQRKARPGRVTGGRVFGYDKRRIARAGRKATARRAADQRSRGRRCAAHLRPVRRRRWSDAHNKDPQR